MKNLSIVCVIVTVCLLNIPTLQDDQGDWVDVHQLLPDLLVHPFFSGYLNLSINVSKKPATASYFYTYYPSQSNPSKDPLILTISPGPGCSGLHSFLYYKGPFTFLTNSSQLKYNQFHWNKNANILFIEGPEGVGFSTGDNSSKLNDQTYVQFLFDAILKFYAKFPELKDQVLYLTGEQYAGQIIPKLAVEIVKHNRDQTVPSWQKIKLRGLLLTNPCTLGNQCDKRFQFSPYTVQFLKNHYYISRQAFEQYQAKCTIIFSVEQCQKVKQKLMANFQNTGADLANPYKDCLHQGDKYKCVDYIGIENFFSHEKAKTLMHADPSINWELCNMKVLDSFERDPLGSYHTYQQLLKVQHQLKIWIVSGILDGNIPTYGTKMWFDQLKNDLNLQTTRLWEPWFYDGQINAGDIETIRGMSLITIRSAGLHMFLDQPELGQYVLKTFLTDNGEL